MTYQFYNNNIKIRLRNLDYKLIKNIMLRRIKSIASNWVGNQKRNVKSKFRVLTMCKKCYTFHYNKSWHFERPEYLDNYTEEVPVRFTQCPACLEQELALYEIESNLVLGRV